MFSRKLRNNVIYPRNPRDPWARKVLYDNHAKEHLMKRSTSIFLATLFVLVSLNVRGLAQTPAERAPLIGVTCRVGKHSIYTERKILNRINNFFILDSFSLLMLLVPGSRRGPSGSSRGTPQLKNLGALNQPIYARQDFLL